jgi:Ni,Fe-hydrogenase III large subunit
MSKPDLRAPTSTASARLTQSGMRALEKEAKGSKLRRSDMLRALAVEALRLRGHVIEDARADRSLGLDESEDA